MRSVRDLSKRATEFFPVSEEETGTYKLLSGAWYGISCVCAEQVIDQAEHGAVSADPKTFAGMVILSAVTAGAGAFFMDRFWESQGE